MKIRLPMFFSWSNIWHHLEWLCCELVFKKKIPNAQFDSSCIIFSLKGATKQNWNSECSGCQLIPWAKNLKIDLKLQIEFLNRNKLEFSLNNFFLETSYWYWLLADGLSVAIDKSKSWILFMNFVLFIISWIQHRNSDI